MRRRWWVYGCLFGSLLVRWFLFRFPCLSLYQTRCDVLLYWTIPHYYITTTNNNIWYNHSASCASADSSSVRFWQKASKQLDCTIQTRKEWNWNREMHMLVKITLSCWRHICGSIIPTRTCWEPHDLYWRIFAGLLSPNPWPNSDASPQGLSEVVKWNKPAWSKSIPQIVLHSKIVITDPYITKFLI